MSSSRDAEFQPDDIVDGRYRILRKLADGGMGTVFLAEHMLIKRRVAIKQLHAELVHDRAMVDRFLKEAAAAGTLGHPHIVESTDMGFARNGTPFIVFEYLEGCLLIEEITRLGGLPVRRALHIAGQLASALEAAHGARIAHLDLKSDNVFLTDRGGDLDHVKLLDFGISRFMEADHEATQPGLLVGTPEFMAPEQVTMPDLVDGRADIYALGVLLYEMLCGRCPYVHDDPRVLLHQIVHEPPPALRVPVPRALEHFLFDRMLVKSRDARVQTMREVQDALAEIAAALLGPVPEALGGYDEPRASCAAPASRRTRTRISAGTGSQTRVGSTGSHRSLANGTGSNPRVEDGAGDGATHAEPAWIVESWFDDDQSKLIEIVAPEWEVEVWP